MKCAARVALGVAGGYLLGRTKKLKFAMCWVAWRRVADEGGPGQLLAQGQCPVVKARVRLSSTGLGVSLREVSRGRRR